jgi:hypothetical protein
MKTKKALIAAALAGPAFHAAGAVADPLPLPQADYVAVMKTADLPEPITVRFHDGVFRWEFDAKGEHTLLIDTKTQVATGLENIDGKKTATEMPAAAFNVPEPGKDVGAKKVGTDKVLGEDCDLWRRPNPEIKVDSDVCIAKDGVWLRVTRPDYKEPFSLVTKLDRAAQDPALFTVPADYVKGAPTDTP